MCVSKNTTRTEIRSNCFVRSQVYRGRRRRVWNYLEQGTRLSGRGSEHGSELKSTKDRRGRIRGVELQPDFQDWFSAIDCCVMTFLPSDFNKAVFSAPSSSSSVIYSDVFDDFALYGLVSSLYPSARTEKSGLVPNFHKKL
jgi:hypothetical protein